MKNFKHSALALFLLFFLTACASSRVSTIPVSGWTTTPVHTIAIDPEDTLLADAVGIELSNHGFTVIDSAATWKLLSRLNLNETEVARPVGLDKLKAQGIDAYLTVRAENGSDQKIQSASARLHSTATGHVIAGIDWQNGWDGMAGTIGNRVIRKSLAEASGEIATALVNSLSPNSSSNQKQGITDAAKRPSASAYQPFTDD